MVDDSNYLEALSAIEKEYAELPDGASLILKIKQRLNEIHSSPPIEECQRCLNISSLTKQVIQGILFYPSLIQVSYYPALLVNAKLRSVALTLIFLLHRYVRLVCCSFSYLMFDTGSNGGFFVNLY